jgi:roadblock/LC7 domain-containing protein
MAPAIAAALMADDGPLVAQLQTMMNTNEKALAAALPGAISAAMVNLTAEITQAIKGLLPFPL